MAVVENIFNDYNFAVSDIKSSPHKPHRILISYRNVKSKVSTVMLFSLNKNKIIQKLEFVPSFYQELGQAVAVEFSPDHSRFAVVFTSGKIQVFKIQSHQLSGIIRPLYQVELDNSYPITQANLRWRDV